jgi:excisionase family DNA binding protein
MSNARNVTVREAAVRLGCTLTHIYNLVRAERLPGSFKQDGKWNVPLSELEAHQVRRKSRRSNIQLASKTLVSPRTVARNSMGVTT